jgi:ankyrin repeat protein
MTSSLPWCFIEQLGVNSCIMLVAFAEIHSGSTALHESIRSGKLGVLKALIGFGLDKNLLTAAGLSPLHYARYYFGKNHEITKYLESIGASDIKLPENQQEREYKNEEL